MEKARRRDTMRFEAEGYIFLMDGRKLIRIRRYEELSINFTIFSSN